MELREFLRQQKLKQQQQALEKKAETNPIDPTEKAKVLREELQKQFTTEAEEVDKWKQKASEILKEQAKKTSKEAASPSVTESSSSSRQSSVQAGQSSSKSESSRTRSSFRAGQLSSESTTKVLLRITDKTGGKKVDAPLTPFDESSPTPKIPSVAIKKEDVKKFPNRRRSNASFDLSQIPNENKSDPPVSPLTGKEKNENQSKEQTATHKPPTPIFMRTTF